DRLLRYDTVRCPVAVGRKRPLHEAPEPRGCHAAPRLGRAVDRGDSGAGQRRRGDRRARTLGRGAPPEDRRAEGGGADPPWVGAAVASGDAAAAPDTPPPA